MSMKQLIQFNKSSLGLAEVCLTHEILHGKKKVIFFSKKKKCAFLKSYVLSNEGESVRNFGFDGILLSQSFQWYTQLSAS